MRFSLIVILFISAVGAFANIDSLRTEERNGQLYVIHQVDPGETLYRISRRYQADEKKVVAANGIENNSIRVGQILSIPLKKPEVIDSTESMGTLHVVKSGETLYGLSRKYKVSQSDIKKWNSLKSNALNVGQRLSIGKKAENIPVIEALPFAGARKHFVQPGETLGEIAKKRNVSADSLRNWNNLRSIDIKIGQILWYRNYDRSSEMIGAAEVFGKKVEEGIAKQIEDLDDSDKYLALHKELPTGTLIEVRNLMNNKKVFVRVVGQLPSTGVNENIVIRLTAKSFKRLGILDSRARVELTYYDE